MITDLIGKSKLFGKEDGGAKKFDDSMVYTSKELAFPDRIIIRKGVIIDRYGFGYGTQELVHGGSGGTLSVYPLAKGEYVVKVSGNSASFRGSWTLENLMFYTNKGNRYGTGEKRGAASYFEYAASKGKAVCCLFGAVDKYANCIGFYEMPTGIKPGGGFPEIRL